jgi:hypothetical protein
MVYVLCPYWGIAIISRSFYDVRLKCADGVSREDHDTDDPRYYSSINNSVRLVISLSIFCLNMTLLKIQI